jgi:hypothetical protein
LEFEDASDDAAIGAQHLAVDPGTVRSCEEGDGTRYVLRSAEPLERGELRKAVPDLVRLALEKQVSSNRSGRP